MSQFNIFQAFYMSFYSKELYRDVGRNWGGGAFLYLFLLVSLVWTIYAVTFIPPLYHFDHVPFDKVVAEIPVVVINEGVLSTPENRPYIIENDAPTKHKKFKLIIDTTGQYTSLDHSDADILVTAQTTMMRTKPNEVRVYHYPKDMTETINPIEWKNILIKALYVMAVPVLFFVILGAFCYHILKALIYSLIGKVFASSLSYGTILQITLVAITPALLLSLLLSLLHQDFYMEWLVYFIISMFYMFYGISANKE